MVEVVLARMKKRLHPHGVASVKGQGERQRTLAAERSDFGATQDQLSMRVLLGTSSVTLHS